ncbi:MAG: NADP-dependent oxidoreductase [Roseobacter sp.]|jgi:alcohol dehydrogenase|nr:NADP-dependent oxidoreductase [Roseobacter sp.]
MAQIAKTNRRIVLASRPRGLPDDDTLRLEECPVPDPGSGEMLLRTEFLSIDPYMRGRMDDAKSYAPPLGLGDVMPGSVIAEVVASNIDDFAPGDRVLAGSGWQDFAVSDGSGVKNLGPAPDNPTWYLGLLGMPGYTAYAGLTVIGAPQPGETLVVAAASGPVGATVGQIARIKGCKVIGVAGGAEKCRHVVDVLGFDACLDHRDPDIRTKLAAACPDGIDIYFENVGGKVLYAVLPLLNDDARVPVCGVVSWYNLSSLPDGKDYAPLVMSTILKSKVKMQGFIITDSFAPETYEAFRQDMTSWVKDGKIAYKEQIVRGLENAPRALNDVLLGRNFGKMVVSAG